MPYSPQDLHKKVLGKRGEKLVAEYLKKQGVTILEKNYKTPFGEADLIAKQGDEILFVEVKTRASDKFGSPKEAVTPQKRNRYIAIAKYYGARHGGEPNARFDVAEVFADGTIEYLDNAF